MDRHIRIGGERTEIELKGEGSQYFPPSGRIVRAFLSQTGGGYRIGVIAKFGAWSDAFEDFDKALTALQKWYDDYGAQ